MLLAAKILYSMGLTAATGALLFVALTLVQEVWRVWFDTETYLTEFNYDEAGEAKSAKGKVLTSRFERNLKWLEGELVEEEPRQTGVAGAEIYRPPSTYAFPRDSSPLTNLNFNWQGIDVSGILQGLRKTVWNPPRLSAEVSKGAEYSAVLKWPNAPKLPSEHVAYSTDFFSIDGRNDEERLIMDLSCRVFWLKATAEKPVFTSINPHAFCEWAWMHRNVQRLQLKVDRTAEGLDANDVAELRKLEKQLPNLVRLDPDFSRTQKLTAQISSLLPESIRVAQDRETHLTSIVQATITAAVPDPVQRKTILDEKNISASGAPLSGSSTYDYAGYQTNGTLAPGVPLQIGSSAPSISAGPIVVDGNGKRFLVVPDYALPDEAAAAAMKGGVSVRLATGDLVGRVLVGEAARAARVANLGLIELETNKFTNSIPLKGGPQRIDLFQLDVPVLNSQVRIVHSGYFGLIAVHEQNVATTAAVRSVAVPERDRATARLFEVKPRISGAGLGGAPIVNDQNKLVGMSYMGAGDGSRPLIIKDAFERLGLKLFQQ